MGAGRKVDMSPILSGNKGEGADAGALSRDELLARPPEEWELLRVQVWEVSPWRIIGRLSNSNIVPPFTVRS